MSFGGIGMGERINVSVVMRLDAGIRMLRSLALLRERLSCDTIWSSGTLDSRNPSCSTSVVRLLDFWGTGGGTKGVMSYVTESARARPSGLSGDRCCVRISFHASSHTKALSSEKAVSCASSSFSASLQVGLQMLGEKGWRTATIPIALMDAGLERLLRMVEDRARGAWRGGRPEATRTGRREHEGINA